MQHGQVLVYESDGKLAASLRELSQRRRVWLRELRQPQACLTALQRGGPAVLILKIGRDLDRELGLLERLGRLYPETRTIVAGDTPHPALAALAWDLGAYFVLFPPTPLEALPELVDRLLPEPAKDQPT